jgi:hypothetical protein
MMVKILPGSVIRPPDKPPGPRKPSRPKKEIRNILKINKKKYRRNTS